MRRVLLRGRPHRRRAWYTCTTTTCHVRRSCHCAPIGEIESRPQADGLALPHGSRRPTTRTSTTTSTSRSRPSRSPRAVPSTTTNTSNPVAGGPLRRQRILQGRCRPDLPCLFDVWAPRRRGVPWGLQVFRYDTPRGRDENGPYQTLADWVRPHNMYGSAGVVEANGRYHSASCACAVHE